VETPVWDLGVYGGGPEGGEAGIMKLYEYSPEGADMPDVTVTCAAKKLLVPPIPADWQPEDGDTAERQPVWQITWANPEGPDHGGNTDFETIGTAIDRGDAVKFRFPEEGGGAKAKAFSICREEPGYFDICAKVYPYGHASGFLHHMQVGDKIDCFVHRKGKRVSRDRRAGSHVALIAFGVGITECLPMAACELAQPEPQSVRLLWSARSRGDSAFWRDQIEALQAMYPERFSFVEIFSRDDEWADQVGALKGRITPDLCKEVFDQYWGTYVGGPNEAARPHVRFQNVAEKALLKEADKYWETELGYPKWSQRLCLDAGDATPEKAQKGAVITHDPPTL
jgi:ferredoxin-NADP reductase